MVLVGVAVGGALALVAVLIPWLPSADSSEAHKVDDVYWFVTIICMAIFALVAGVSVYAVWKFRAAPDDEEDGSPIHGHTGLEVVWTAVPAALVTAISIYSGVVLVQVERIPDAAALSMLRRGVKLRDGITAPAGARLIGEPDWLWPREPPIRYRRNVPAAWLEITLSEGRNRQVRRMTAAAGHPTLRLMRVAIGAWSLDGLRPGEWEVRR